ncbi:MAG: leucine--tRNA ligase [Saprospirales bacterium]|nr:MAG: leucine--tRNA ligase [Saprospirales bacterium]
MEYNPRPIEKKWQKYWESNEVYKVETNPDKPKFYVLDMFPYPSGAGLHVGHPLGYIASDIMSRFKRHTGHQVLHPMGYDAFGLPAEQYAIQTGVHPAVSTQKNINRYRKQLANLGFDYDWSREVATCDPSYYKWTQWIFLQWFQHYYCTAADKALPISQLVEEFESKGNTETTAFENQDTIRFSASQWRDFSAREKDDILMNYRIAYRKTAYVNWCPQLGTVLANDEVKDGKSERGGYPVERKPMVQWSLRISAYSERLLHDLETLDWSDSLKTIQKNWIGKSTGAMVQFDLESTSKKIEVFTTRPDTLFGVTFMVLAPEHPLVDTLTTDEQRDEISAYQKKAAGLSERDRQSNVDDISGAFTGGYALHPITKKRLPVWISDYVLMDYGTGAIMAVPSDDERDNKFAHHFKLPIIPVVDKTSENPSDHRIINSDFLNGLSVEKAKARIIEEIERSNIGNSKVKYKLRDAIFSRQRYWGEPIPIVYDREGVAHPLSVKDLPLKLPETDDYQPGEDGRSPLSKIKDWVNLPNGYKRETDTMPGFAGSSWYFLRYMDPRNDDSFASSEAIEYWRDVDLYIGGTEHAVGHLIYARFCHKFLYDIGKVVSREPFKKLINQGMIQGIIESIYMDKRESEPARFVCSSIAEKEGLKNFTNILVHADFVNEYGNQDSFLSEESIRKFLNWQPAFSKAKFECPGGIFQKGKFNPHPGSNAKENHLLTHSEVGKMSKSKYNVINPDEVIEEYGTDCFRMYEMFLGPIEQSKPWDTMGIDGVSKFLRRFWDLFFKDGAFTINDENPPKKAKVTLHNTIKRVREDIERFSFNTCVSHFMVCTNELRKAKTQSREILEPLIVLIAPFAPHMAEELWHLSGRDDSVARASYPDYDPEVLKKDELTYPVAVNGKKRTELTVPADMPKQELEKTVAENEVILKWKEGKDIKRIIVVPGKMINVVIK